MRFVALGGLEPSQARPQQAPLVGAALETVLPSVVARAALGHPQAPIVGAALVALGVAALRSFGCSQARPKHAPLVGAAFVVVLPSVAAPVALRYAALGGFGPSQARPQHAPLVEAALMHCYGHHQARSQPGRRC